MENQSKYIMIERNKFAALVKAHRKCLQILSILTYAHTVKEVQLTFTLEEICELLQMTREDSCKSAPIFPIRSSFAYSF